MPLHTFRSSLILSFLLVAVTVAQEVSLNDFRIRESQYQRWDVRASGAVDVRSSSTSNSAYWGDNAGINLGTNYNREFNSENEFYRVSTRFDSRLSKNFYGTQYTWDSSRSSSRNEALTINSSAQYGAYIIPDEWYVFAGGYLVGQHELSRYDYTSTSGSSTLSFNKRRIVDIQASGGIGFGKVRDARAVIVIVRILEDLSEEGVLVRPLSNDEIIAMAEQYHADYITNAQHDRRTKYLIGAIISDLLEKGLITAQQSIGYVTGRSIEVFSEQIFSRSIGWKVQTGPSFSFTDDRHYAENNFYDYDRDPNHRWRVSAEYGVAPSQLMRFSTTATIDLPVLSWQRQLESRMSATLTHEIGERSSAMVSLDWNKNESIGNIDDPGLSRFNDHYFTFQSQYVYLLEDNLSLTVGFWYSDNRSIGEQLMNTYRNVGNNGNINFDLVYRLD